MSDVSDLAFPVFVRLSLMHYCIKRQDLVYRIDVHLLPSVSRYLKRIRLSLNPNGIVDTSNGANLHPTPLRDSRYTFRQ